MNHDVLASQMIRALRGPRSQPALSRWLGYTSNVVYAWESGRRSPEASALFALVAKIRPATMDDVAAFFGHAAIDAGKLTKADGITALVNVLVASRKATEVARAIKKDRTTVSRWLKGSTEPRVHELLSLIDFTTSRLLEFVSLFVDPEQLLATRAAYRDLLAQRKLAYELPWSHAVLRALELSSYLQLPKHVPGFIAQQIGISLEDEERHLAALVNSKQIRKGETHYRLRRVMTVDTRPSEEDNRRLKLHWASVATERFAKRQTASDALFSFNLFGVSQETYAQIRTLHLEYYQRVRELIGASSSAERVVLLNMQLIPLGIDDAILASPTVPQT